MTQPVMLSRVADSLYWLSRYMERAEHVARVLDVQLNVALDRTGISPSERVQFLAAALGATHLHGNESLYEATQQLTFDTQYLVSIAGCIAAARENARHVREQISSEMWEQVNRLYFQTKDGHIDRWWNEQPHDFFRAVKEGVHLFQGIADSTMINGEGWQFIQAGRCMERTYAVSRIVDAHFRRYPYLDFREVVSQNFLEWVALLKSCTAYEAYCKVYTAYLRPDHIAEYLLLNAHFPHTVRYAVTALDRALHEIAAVTENKNARVVNRLSGRLRAQMEYTAIDEVLAGGLHRFIESVQEQCTLIHQALYRAYIAYSAEAFVS
jgi:uncharacterized alpha-E superfamily protein